MTTTFRLPKEIAGLLTARNALRGHYNKVLAECGSTVDLRFTFDGNLIGDIGEALAVEMFGVRLVDGSGNPAIDAIAPDGKKTVQIKATGTGRGPAFRNTQLRADHLIFFDLDFDRSVAEVVYNGPEHIAFSLFPSSFAGQRSLTAAQIRKAASRVAPEQRLPLRTNWTPLP